MTTKTTLVALVALLVSSTLTAQTPAGSHLDPVAAAAIAEDGAPPRGNEPPPNAGDGLRFEDVAAAAGLSFRYTFGDYAYDNILESSGSGVLWLDHDGDGDQDLYLLNGTYIENVSDPKGRVFEGERNRFYCNEGDATFTDCTEASGLGDPVWSMGASAGDFDDDGDLDVFLANYGPNRLFRNDGDGSFVDVAEEVGLVGPEALNGFVKWSVGASWLDADRDGDLDLMVCNFLAFDPYHLHPGKEWEMPQPAEYRGQPSLLYLQDGGRFVDRTREAGLYREGSRCMGITVLDFDGDGWLDVFQGNDHQPNFLFRARGDGTYEEIGESSGLAVNDEGIGTGSMHGSPGDVDGDGRLDLLVVDLRHGSLYRRSGEAILFADATWASGVGHLLDGLGQWGAGLQDLDNDGDLDLFTTNGVAHILVGQYPMLAANDGQGHFRDARGAAGPYFATPRSGRGAAFADYDNDGDLDIVVNHVDHRASVALLRNVSDAGAWVGFELVGRRPRTAYGARLELEAGGRRLVRVHQPNAGYLSANDPRVHFGLGTATAIDRLTVRWPSGAEQSWAEIETGRYWVLEEGVAEARPASVR